MGEMDWARPGLLASAASAATDQQRIEDVFITNPYSQVTVTGAEYAPAGKMPLARVAIRSTLAFVTPAVSVVEVASAVSATVVAPLKT